MNGRERSDIRSATGCLRFMLSAQRLSDVAGMRWSEIDGDVWTIPAARHKSKRRHEVPLSASLEAIIFAKPQHDEHVFLDA